MSALILLSKTFIYFLNDKPIAFGGAVKKLQVTVGGAVFLRTETPVNLTFNVMGTGYSLPDASVNNTPDSLLKAIDGRMWDFEEIPNYWSTYGSGNKTDWYSINFGKPVFVSNCKVWFYSDGKNFKLPTNVKVEYYNGKEWKAIQYRVPKINLRDNTLVSFCSKK